jgi:hypothetical protein
MALTSPGWALAVVKGKQDATSAANIRATSVGGTSFFINSSFKT